MLHAGWFQSLGRAGQFPRHCFPALQHKAALAANPPSCRVFPPLQTLHPFPLLSPSCPLGSVSAPLFTVASLVSSAGWPAEWVNCGGKPLPLLSSAGAGSSP